jgi:hypothetical protein
MSVEGLSSGRSEARTDFRLDRRQVALNVDHEVHLRVRIGLLDGLENPVRAALMVLPGHHHVEARGGHGVVDVLVIDGDDDSPDLRFLGPFCYLHDHRQAGNIRQRFPRQAGRCHSRRDQHQRPVKSRILHERPFYSRVNSVKKSHTRDDNRVATTMQKT